MALLNHKCLPALKGMYEATVKSYKEVENDKGGYIEVIFQLEDRTYTYCIFPTQLDYVTSCLNNQFGLERDELSLGECLKKATKESIHIWFSYNQDVQRMNLAFHDTTVANEDIEDTVL